MDNLTPITREEMLMNDEPLTPITREEKILAGEDLNPVTRREYFLKKYRHAGGDVMVEGLEVTANGTYTAPEGKAYSPVEVAVPLPDNAYLLKEASGSLVSFSDGADLPMPSFVCNIDAVQDLHGYDHPWAGGAGKNKLPCTSIDGTYGGGVVVKTNSDGSISFTGTPTETFYIVALDFALPQGTYTFSRGNDIVSASELATRMINTDTSTNIFTLGNSQPSATFTLSATTNLRFVIFTPTVASISGKLYPMIEVDSTATSYAPYSNICPISGHTGVDAVISPTTEASAGTTYSVSWQTEAGEVFGGYVDLVSGVLTVTHKSQTGFTRGSQDSSNKLYKIGAISDIKAYTNVSAISPYYVDSMFEKMSLQGARAAETPSITHHDHTFYVGGYIGKEAELDTLLGTLQVKYELETPITYQLTPHQIKSLRGNNNAWCDTGDVDIDYFARR